MLRRNCTRFFPGTLVVCLVFGLNAASAGLDISNKQYKRIHIRAMQGVFDGQAEAAAEALLAYAAEHPDDQETWYTLAVAYAELGNTPEALRCIEKAVDKGLSFGRFVAGPRDVLGEVQKTEAFAQLAREHLAKPVHGPMIGAVTPDSARVWVRTCAETGVDVKVSTSPNMAAAFATFPGRSLAGEDYTAVVQLDGLKPNTRYYFEVATGCGHYAPGQFTTSPPDGEAAAFRVVFGGGAGYVPPHEYVWDNIRRDEPDAFLWLGDNVYIDHPEYPRIQDYCYYRRQSVPSFHRLAAVTPYYAIYDDHDFGDNDCWGGPRIETPAWKRPVWRVFRRNWVNPYYAGGPKQPGCWHDFLIGDVHFIMLDCRYYRTDPKIENPSMLGPVQKEWLFERLNASSATFTVLASSVPWAEGTKPGSLDTWDGYPEERKEIYDFLHENRIEGVVLLSADRHRSDAWKNERAEGYPLYEFESSRLTNQHVHKEMPGAVFSYNDTQSYGLIDFDTTASEAQLTYRICDIDGQQVYELTLKRSQLEY